MCKIIVRSVRLSYSFSQSSLSFWVYWLVDLRRKSTLCKRLGEASGRKIRFLVKGVIVPVRRSYSGRGREAEYLGNSGCRQIYLSNHYKSRLHLSYPYLFKFRILNLLVDINWSKLLIIGLLNLSYDIRLTHIVYIKCLWYYQNLHNFCTPSVW